MLRQRFFARAVAAAAALAALWANPAAAQTHRALVVGIDQYSAALAGDRPRVEAACLGGPARESVPDLRGAVRDARDMAALLVARFGFDAANVALLLDEAATREAILQAFREQLIEPSEPGDVVVFHFSGHGSRIRNSASDSPNQLDQTLVPFDAHLGARDIWDKEVAALLHELLDRGVHVTASFDCCFSGSIARGEIGTRTAPWDEREASEVYCDFEPVAGPSPAARGALVLTASRDDQVAREVLDPLGDPRGLFTGSLIDVLRTVSPLEPARRVFLRVEARMRASGLVQDPGLEGLAPEDTQRPLFGAAGSSGFGDVAVPLVHWFADSGEAHLRAGGALGLAPGAVLAGPELEDGSRVRLEVTEVTGPQDCLAVVVGGDPAALRPGIDLFEVESWTSRGGAFLFVHVPDDVELPGLTFGDDSVVRTVDDPADAQYRLTSTSGFGGGADPRDFFSGTFLYWVSTAGHWTSGSSPLPSETRPIPRRAGGDAETARQLIEAAHSLARIRAWLTLDPPTDSRRFPFHLLVEREGADGRQPIDDGRVESGDRLYFSLERGVIALDKFGRPQRGERRYVYLFVVDSSGASTLIYPSATAAAAENRFPAIDVDLVDLPERIELPVPPGRVRPPYGIDTFVLLTTREPLPDPWALQWGAVRGEDTPERQASPLFQLVGDLNEPRRGPRRPMPVAWSIERVSIDSRARD